MNALVWRKSSYSNGDQGLCVEVAVGAVRVVPVRDSKDHEIGIIDVPRGSWAQLLGALKR